MKQSELERHMETRLKQFGIEMVAEYRFHPTRRWRFDFADPDNMIAVECEGGTWSGGRHVRGQGFANDCEKYNEAARLGWKVFRFPRKKILSDEAIDYMVKVYQRSES